MDALAIFGLQLVLSLIVYALLAKWSGYASPSQHVSVYVTTRVSTAE